MVYVWMLSSFVVYTKMTESDEEPEIDLERHSQCYYDIGDEMFGIINSDEYKTEIDRFKAYYLTNSGYYVPNELRKSEDMSRMNLGDYKHDIEALDRKISINEESMDKFAETMNTLTGIDETISLEDQDAAAIGLIFSGVNFYLSNTFHLLSLFVLFDKCDGSEKDKASNPSFYTVGDEQLQVLNLIRGEIECRFIEWQDDMKKSRDEIGKLAEKHKKNLNNKKESKSKSQSIQFEELKKYYSQIEDYHRKMKAVFECISSLNKQSVDKNFFLGLTKYITNLVNYCSHFAKIFAKRTKELVKPLDKGLDADTRSNLGSLKQAVTSVMDFVNLGTYDGFGGYKTLVSHHNKANPDEKIDISHFGQLRYDTVIELIAALQLIENVPEEELPEFDRPLILTCKRLTIMLGGAILSCGTASYLWYIRN